MNPCKVNKLRGALDTCMILCFCSSHGSRDTDDEDFDDDDEFDDDDDDCFDDFTFFGNDSVTASEGSDNDDDGCLSSNTGDPGAPAPRCACDRATIISVVMEFKGLPFGVVI